MQTDTDNPYVRKPHRAALAASAQTACMERSAARDDDRDGEFSAFIAAGGRGLSSNYPRELTALVESESDGLMRQNVAYRQIVRNHLVGAKMADARHGLPDWERYWLKRERADAREERREVREAVRAAR